MAAPPGDDKYGLASAGDDLPEDNEPTQVTPRPKSPVGHANASAPPGADVDPPARMAAASEPNAFAQAAGSAKSNAFAADDLTAEPQSSPVASLPPAPSAARDFAAAAWPIARWLVGSAAVLAIAYFAGFFVAKQGLVGRVLQVRAIDVAGLGRTPRDEALAAAKVGIGKPILGIGLPQSAAALEALPWVSTASVRRQLPFRMAITVTEHTPKVAAMLGELWLVNEEGVPFKKFAAQDALVLPTVTGLAARPAAEQPYAAQAPLCALLREAIALGDELTRLRDDLFAVEELHHDPDLGWSAVLLLGRAQGQRRGQRAGVAVHLGADPVARLPQLVSVLAELADRRLTPKTIWAANLRQAGRVQVALADGEGVAADDARALGPYGTPSAPARKRGEKLVPRGRPPTGQPAPEGLPRAL